MRAVVQRVSGAVVEVDGEVVGKIADGILVYLGVGETDIEKDLEYLAVKVAGLRIFPDEKGLMNRSVLETGGAALVISQFTLYGDVRRGKRPSFTAAMSPDAADVVYDEFCDRLRTLGIHTEKGRFGAMMDVTATNAGPVTILIDSDKTF